MHEKQRSVVQRSVQIGGMKGKEMRCKEMCYKGMHCKEMQVGCLKGKKMDSKEMQKGCIKGA
eukprot:1157732-Pelagomonas_calceolata.AAC.16